MWLLVPRFYPAVLPSLVPLLLGGWFKLLFSCTFLWIWNKGLGKSWLFWQGAVPLFPLSISQIVPDAAKAAKTQDLQGSGMESSGMQILIVLTILKCVSRYYLIFCPFCPFFFHWFLLCLGFLRLCFWFFLFSKKPVSVLWSQAVSFACHGGLSLTFSVSLLSLGSKTLVSPSDSLIQYDRNTCGILEESGGSQLVLYIRDSLFSENFSTFTKGGIVHPFIYKYLAHTGSFCYSVLTPQRPST